MNCNRYNKHIELVERNIGAKLKDNNKLKEFMDYYKGSYNKFERIGLDYRVAFLLYKDKRKVSKSAIRWYGIVGPGGTGKSTLAKNICYFLDNSFGAEYITDSFKGIIKLCLKNPITGAFKSILADEPDMEIHPNSKSGRGIRDTFGKLRQQQIYIVFCATDLIDIPPFIFKKLDTIIMTSRLGEGIVIRNDYERYMYPISDLRQVYMIKNYGVFFNMLKKGIAFKINTYNFTPLSERDEKIYKDNKEKDLRETQDKAYKLLNDDKVQSQENKQRFEEITEMLKNGKKKKEIATKFGISYVHLNRILRQFNYKNIEHKEYISEHMDYVSTETS